MANPCADQGEAQLATGMRAMMPGQRKHFFNSKNQECVTLDDVYPVLSQWIASDQTAHKPACN
eukprot:1140615-Pelagomonas_calceolata.AAC.4